MKITKNDIVENRNENMRDILLAKGEQDNREYYSAMAKADLEANPDKLKAFKEKAYEGGMEDIAVEDAINGHEPLTFFGVSTTGLMKGDKDSVYTDEKGVAHMIANRKDEPFLFVAKTFAYDKNDAKYKLSDFMYLPMEVTNKELITACLCTASNYDVFAQSSVNKDAYLEGIGVVDHKEAVGQIEKYFNNHDNALNITYTNFHSAMLQGIGVDIFTDIDMEKVVGIINTKDQFLFENKGRTSLIKVASELLGKNPTDTIDKIDCQIGILEWLAQNRLALEKPINVVNLPLQIETTQNEINKESMYFAMKKSGLLLKSEITLGLRGLDFQKYEEKVDVVKNVEEVRSDMASQFKANFGIDMDAVKKPEVSAPASEEKDDNYYEDDNLYEAIDEGYDYDDVDYFEEYEEEHMTDIDEIDVYGVDKVEGKETTAEVVTPRVSVTIPDYTKQFEGLLDTLTSSLKASEARNHILEEKLEVTNEQLKQLTLIVDNFVKVYSAKEIEKSQKNTSEIANVFKSAEVDLSESNVK